eukprot:g14928.t1
MNLVRGYGSSSSDDDEPKQHSATTTLEPPKAKGKARAAAPRAAVSAQAASTIKQPPPTADTTSKKKRKSSSSSSSKNKKATSSKKKKKKSKTINALVLSPEIQAALARGETLGDSDSDDDDSAADKKPPKIIRRPPGSNPNDLLSLLPQPSTAVGADDILLKNRRKRAEAKAAESQAAAAAAGSATAVAAAAAATAVSTAPATTAAPAAPAGDAETHDNEPEQEESDSDDGEDEDDLLAGMRAKSAEAAAGGSAAGLASTRSSPLFTLPSRARPPPGAPAADPPPPPEQEMAASAVLPIGDDTALAAPGYSVQGRQWGAMGNGQPVGGSPPGGYGGAGYGGVGAGVGAQYGTYGAAPAQQQQHQQQQHASYYQPAAAQAAAGFRGAVQQHGAGAHEAEFGGGGGKATRRKGRDMERALARGDLGALGSETPVMDLHQGSNEYNPLRTKPMTAAMKQDQKHIETSVYDPRTGKTVKTLEPTSMQKRKHQINQLAVQAASMERDLMERSGASRLTKAQTHAKGICSLASTESPPPVPTASPPSPLTVAPTAVDSEEGPADDLLFFLPKSKAQKEAERLQAEEDERKAEILRVRREAERVRKEAEDAKRLKEEQIAERTEELERLASELQGAQDQVPELDQAMERCVYGESIAADLLNGTGEALENGNTWRVSRNGEFLDLLRGLSSDKIDFATAHLLSHWDSISGGDEDFDRMCTTAGGIRFGVWVNVSLKGFRMKTVDFAAAGMSTDVPRPLSGASIAVRNIFVPYRFVRNNKNSSSSNSNRRGVGTVAVGAEAEADRDGDPSGAGGGAAAGVAARKVVQDEKIVLGGTFCLDILALPPGIKKIKGWVFRAETELSKAVARQTYPLDGGNAALAPALRVQFEVPDGVVVPTTPEVRCWDPDLSCWTSEGIEEAEWQSARRVVRLHTTRVGSIAIVQDRARDLSYLGWRLTPIYDPDPLSEGVEGIEDDTILLEEQVPEAELQLETPRFLVRIRIRGTKCRLLGPELPELRSLLDAPGMGAGRLIMELERAGKEINAFKRMEREGGWGGICLSPRDEDATRAAPVVGVGLNGNGGIGGEVGQGGDASNGEGQDARKSGVVLKDRILEETLCREVASVAAAFEMRSSRWNGSLGEGRSVFEIRETGAFTGGEGDLMDFKTTLMELDKVSDSAHNAPDVGTAPCPVKCALVNGSGAEMGGRGADSGSDGRGIGFGGSTGSGAAMMDTTRLPAEDTHA